MSKQNNTIKRRSRRFAANSSIVGFAIVLVAVSVVTTVALALTPANSRALVAPQSSSGIRTGQYTGNGTTIQVSTLLTSIQSLRIVSLPLRGPVSEAYTTTTIQQAAGQGTFVNGNKRDGGVALERGNFTVTSPDFNQEGLVYHWEAHGD